MVWLVWFGHENRFLVFLRPLFGNPSSGSYWKLIKTYCEEKLFFRIKALDRFRICLGTAAERFLELQLRILAKMCLWVSTEKRFFVPSSFEYSSVRHSIERINFFSLLAGKMLLNSRKSIFGQLSGSCPQLWSSCPVTHFHAHMKSMDLEVIIAKPCYLVFRATAHVRILVETNFQRIFSEISDCCSQTPSD